MEYYECSQCGQRTTSQKVAHINRRMDYRASQFEGTGGYFVPDPGVFCCSCSMAIGGGCDHSSEEEVWS